jgi:hypothetical protein
MCYSQAWEGFGTQTIDNGTHSFVSSRAARGTQPQTAQWQIQVVVDNQDALGWNVVGRCKPHHRSATQIHKSLWLGQQHRSAVYLACSYISSGFFASYKTQPMRSSQRVYYPKAHIVSMGCVFGTGITQSNYQVRRFVQVVGSDFCCHKTSKWANLSTSPGRVPFPLSSSLSHGLWPAGHGRTLFIHRTCPALLDRAGQASETAGSGLT